MLIYLTLTLNTLDTSSRKTPMLYEGTYTDAGAYVDKPNNSNQMRFPPFHTEMLKQVWADAAQNLGRVKIIIAEGIRQSQGNSGFQRVKNLVTFSFQHAPLSKQSL